MICKFDLATERVADTKVTSVDPLGDMEEEQVYFKNDFTGENHTVKIIFRDISYEQLHNYAKDLFNETALGMSIIDGNGLSSMRTVSHFDFPNVDEMNSIPKPVCIYVNPETEPDCCIICMENIIGGGLRTLPCGHVFHASCFNMTISTCPLCRGPTGNRIA